MTGEFAGFPRETFTFLGDLAANNNKPWFEANRAAYEAFYVASARDFVAAIGPRLRAISPGVQFDPKVNGSLFRINRDLRFAKDRAPYQTKLDLWFWHGDRRGWDAPGFFLRLAPDTVGIGTGMHGMEGAQLEAFRHAVVEENSGRALVKAMETVRASGPYEIRGATRKTVPRGLDAGGPRAGLLLYESLWVNFETRPAEATRATFVDFCLGHFKAMVSVTRWLLAEVAAKPSG